MRKRKAAGKMRKAKIKIERHECEETLYTLKIGNENGKNIYLTSKLDLGYTTTELYKAVLYSNKDVIPGDIKMEFTDEGIDLDYEIVKVKRA